MIPDDVIVDKHLAFVYEGTEILWVPFNVERFVENPDIVTKSKLERLWFGNIEIFTFSGEFQVKIEFSYEVVVVSMFVISFPFIDFTSTSNPLPKVLSWSKINLSPTL